MAQASSESPLAAAIQGLLGVGAGLCGALAAHLLLSPSVDAPMAFPFQDKVYHFVVFAALAGPGGLALPSRYLWFWAGQVLALGAGVEVVQALGDAGRSGSIWDFLADAAGVAAALAVARVIRRRFERPAA